MFSSFFISCLMFIAVIHKLQLIVLFRGKCYLFQLPFYMHLMRGGAVNVGHTLFFGKTKMVRMMAVSSFADGRPSSLVMRSAYQDTCQVCVFCVLFIFCHGIFFFSQRLVYYTVVKHQFSYVFISYFDME